MKSWPERDAKALFREFLHKAITEGPQLVSRGGIDAAVLVSMQEWNCLNRTDRPGLKELLLAPEPRFDNLVPKRGQARRRTPPGFS